MKKIFFTILCLLCVAIAFPQFVTLKGRQLYDSTGALFYVKGVNYSVDLYSATASTSSISLKPSSSYYTSDSAYFTKTIADIGKDFQFIHDSLQSNTIRLCVGSGGLDSCHATYIRADLITGSTSVGVVHTHTTSLNFMAPIYQQLLDTANAHHLKVILLLWGTGASCDSGSFANTSYLNYLANTADALQHKKALIAYDEWNEPEFQALGVNQTKNQVCASTNTWYSLIKRYDPNHLVTVGIWAAGLGLDATTYSSDVYKADFYAFHVYPVSIVNKHNDTCISYDATLGHNVTAYVAVADSNPDLCAIGNYIDRYNTAIKWIQNTTNQPWLIGETGYSAKPGYTCGGACTIGGCWSVGSCSLHGDESQQGTFITNALTENIRAGGMGTLFWQFKDVRWNIPSDPVDNYLGLVDQTNRIKGGGRALVAFNDSTVTGQPAAYPSNYQNLLGNTGTPIIGNVGVADAVINGWHIQLNNITNNYDWLSPVQTLSSAGGTYTLTSKTPIIASQPNTTIVNHMAISAIGYDVQQCYGCATLNYTLNKAASFDLQPSPAHYIATSSDPAVNSPNELTLQSFYVTTGTGAAITHTFTAGREIAILPDSTTDSYVAQTAEAAFYIDVSTSVNCSDAAWSDAFIYGRMASNANHTTPKTNVAALQTTDEIQQTKTIYLTAEGFGLQAYPNPANDKVLLQSVKSINFITLSSMYGNIILQLNPQGATQQQIDVSQLAPGTYMIKTTYTDNTTSITQIIKQ